MHVERTRLPMLVGTPQASRELHQHCPGDGRRFGDATPEVVTPQDEELCIVHRDHVRGAWLTVDERQLAEVLTDTEDAEDDLATIFADEYDLDASVPHDEQRVAGIVLEDDDAALRIVTLARDFRESLKLVAANAGEQRDGCEKLYDFHACMRCGR